MNAIFKRRSIRQYTDKEVSDQQIQEILHAGMSAPSAGNQQPWHFVVIKNKQNLAQLAQVSPYSKMLDRAAFAIVVCGDINRQKYEGYWVQDCAAATQNMLLQITDMELGGVWLGVHPRPNREQFVRQMFDLPQNINPFAIISAGYPAETKTLADRYKPARVHFEKW